MGRFRIAQWILAVCLLVGAAAAVPVPVLAQTGGGPGFRIDSWSIAPDKLSRGIEFELTVRFTNVTGGDVTDVLVSIGAGQSFIGLTPGEYIESLDDGDSARVTLRTAVSNSITTGYYSLPIQFSYRQEETGMAGSSSQSIGLYVEGLTPLGQDEGQPAFAITAFTIEPQVPKRGEEFDLTLTIQNIGTWDGDDVLVEIGQGQSFVGLTTSERIEKMQIGETRTVSLRGAVSNQIVTGAYSIPVAISYHHSALGGQRMQEVKNLGVEVEGIAPHLGPERCRPQLVIEDSHVQPGPGEGELTMTLTLRNVGNLWATRVIVNLGRSDIFAPAQGSTAFPVEGTIKLDETATVSLPLTLIRSPGERAVQDFTIEYASFGGAAYQSTQSVPVELGAAEQETPRLLVERYSTEPAVVTPGASFTLTLELANVGSGEARRVFVRLGKDAQALGPLAPVGSSNVLYVERIAGGARTTLSYGLIVDGEAEAGLVRIDLTLEYEDAFGVLRSETVTIGVQVVATPFFQVDFFDTLPEPIYVGDVFELPIEVINIGQRSVNVSTVGVASQRLRITGGSVYIGPLDAGTSGTLVPEAEALQAGTAEITVKVNYLDTFQQPQVYETTLTVEIEPLPLAEHGNSAQTPRSGLRAAGRAGEGGEQVELTAGQRMWRGLLGFLGLGTTPPEEVEIGGERPARIGRRPHP